MTGAIRRQRQLAAGAEPRQVEQAVEGSGVERRRGDRSRRHAQLERVHRFPLHWRALDQLAELGPTIEVRRGIQYDPEPPV